MREKILIIYGIYLEKQKMIPFLKLLIKNNDFSPQLAIGFKKKFRIDFVGTESYSLARQ